MLKQICARRVSVSVFFPRPFLPFLLPLFLCSYLARSFGGVLLRRLAVLRARGAARRVRSRRRLPRIAVTESAEGHADEFPGSGRVERVGTCGVGAGGEWPAGA